MIKSLFKYSIGPIIASFLGIITVPITTRYIDPIYMGKAEMFTIMSNMILVIICLGTPNGIVRFFHEEDLSERLKLMKQAMLWPTILFFFCSVLLVIFWIPCSMYIFGQRNFFGILLLIIVVLFSLLERYTSLLLRMNSKAFRFTVLNIGNKIISFAVIIIFIWFGYINVFTLIVPLAITMLFTWLLGVIWEWEFWFPKMMETKMQTLHTSLSSFYMYSVPFMFAQLIEWLFNCIDRLMLRTFLGESALGIYSAAFKIVIIMNLLRYSISLCWGPEFFRRNAQDEASSEYLRQIYNVLVLLISITIIMTIGWLDIIVLLFGEKYKAIRNVAPLLLLVPAMNILLLIAETGINIAKKTYLHGIINILLCVMHFLFCYLLIPSFGMIGAALASAISAVLLMYLKGFFSVRVMKHSLGLRKSMLPILFVFLFALLNSIYLIPFMFILPLSVIFSLLIVSYYRRMLPLLWNTLINLTSFKRKGC